MNLRLFAVIRRYTLKKSKSRPKCGTGFVVYSFGASGGLSFATCSSIGELAGGRLPSGAFAGASGLGDGSGTAGVFGFDAGALAGPAGLMLDALAGLIDDALAGLIDEVPAGLIDDAPAGLIDDAPGALGAVGAPSAGLGAAGAAPPAAAAFAASDLAFASVAARFFSSSAALSASSRAQSVG